MYFLGWGRSLPGFHAALYKRPIEHLVFVEATHDDEPVDDVAGSPDGEPCCGALVAIERASGSVSEIYLLDARHHRALCFATQG